MIPTHCPFCEIKLSNTIDETLYKCELCPFEYHYLSISKEHFFVLNKDYYIYLHSEESAPGAWIDGHHIQNYIPIEAFVGLTKQQVLKKIKLIMAFQ